jgi:hypothetical protein
MEAKNLAKLYDLPTLEWEPIAAKLDAGYTQAPGTGGPNRHTTWIATIDADGSPNVNGIGSLWLDGAFIFETGRSSRKGRNIERDPRCTISLSLEDFDLVVEGEAELVSDPALVLEVARIYAEDWPCRVDESGIALTADFSAPSAGPPPWHVYRVVPQTAMVLSITPEPGGATRFTF